MRELLVFTPRGARLRCAVAETSRQRRNGFRRPTFPSEAEAVLFPNATSVHTFGMFPILVARLDASFRVLDVRRVRPWRIVAPMRGARHVLECHELVDLRVGDALRFVPPEAGDGGLSAGDRADDREHERRGDRQRAHNEGNEASRPRRQRHGLASRGVRLDDPEELQQRPHR
jgi:uncharacterized membrane protein (UPF0127 family)